MFCHNATNATAAPKNATAGPITPRQLGGAAGYSAHCFWLEVGSQLPSIDTVAAHCSALRLGVCRYGRWTSQLSSGGCAGDPVMEIPYGLVRVRGASPQPGGKIDSRCRCKVVCHIDADAGQIPADQSPMGGTTVVALTALWQGTRGSNSRLLRVRASGRGSSRRGSIPGRIPCYEKRRSSA